MAKTKPIGVRFDEDILKELGGTAQSVLITLESFYRTSKVLVEQKKWEKEKKGLVEILRENALIISVDKDYNTETFENRKVFDNSKIEKQITAIQAEKIPPERNTTFGKKVWASDQQKRISQLQKQIK